jgi:integrase/recombinase XerD
MTNHEILNRFYEHLRVKGYSPRTISEYQSTLNRFAAYLAAHGRQITGLSAGDLSDYRTALYYQQYRGNPISLATQANALARLRTLFQFLAKENLILHDPSVNLELPKLPRSLPKGILTAREAKKILDSIDTSTALGLRDRAILELLYSSGIRVSELTGLQLADLDLSQGILAVQGKGDKPRVVPIGHFACRYLREYLDQARPRETKESALFLSNRGLPMDKQRIAKICGYWAMRAGIKKKVTPHTWRHTCATELLKNAVDIRYIQELLGHASLKTTQIYTKVTIKDLKRIHAKYHPREKGLS